MSALFTEADVIHTYTRADALRDGVLIDLADLAAEAGIRWPVAITNGAHADLIAWPDDSGFQDESGRGWDVIMLARHTLPALCAAAQATGQVPQHRVVPIARVPHGSRSGLPVTTHMVVSIGPGDNNEPVMTISLPGED